MDMVGKWPDSGMNGYGASGNIRGGADVACDGLDGDDVGRRR